MVVVQTMARLIGSYVGIHIDIGVAAGVSLINSRDSVPALLVLVSVTTVWIVHSSSSSSSKQQQQQPSLSLSRCYRMHGRHCRCRYYCRDCYSSKINP
jgi:hypothetical protein